MTMKESPISTKLMNKEKDIKDNCSSLEASMESLRKLISLILRVRKLSHLLRRKKNKKMQFNHRHKRWKMSLKKIKKMMNRKNNLTKMSSDSYLESFVNF